MKRHLIKFNSIPEFKNGNFNSPCISCVMTPAGNSIGYAKLNLFDFYIGNYKISDDNLITIDFTHISTINAKKLQEIIDTWEEGSIAFNSSVAIYLKGRLVLGNKAHWEDNVLVAGGGQYEEDFVTNGLICYFDAIENQGRDNPRESGYAGCWIDKYNGVSLYRCTKHVNDGLFSDDALVFEDSSSSNNNGFHDEETASETFPFKEIGRGDFTYEFVFTAGIDFADTHTGFFSYLTTGPNNGRIQFGIETDGTVKVNTNEGSWENNYLTLDGTTKVLIQPNTYHNLIYTRLNGVVSCYDNGLLIGRTEADVYISSTPGEWAISDNGQGGKHHAHRFYNRALTLEEIEKNVEYDYYRYSNEEPRVRTYAYSIKNGLYGTLGMAAISNDLCFRFNTGNSTGTLKGTAQASLLSNFDVQETYNLLTIQSSDYANHCNSAQAITINDETYIYVSGNYRSTCFVYKYVDNTHLNLVQTIFWDTETEVPELNGMHPNILIGDDGYLWAVADDYNSGVANSGNYNYIYKFARPDLLNASVNLRLLDAIDSFTVKRYTEFDLTWLGMKIRNGKIYFLRGGNVTSKMGIEVIDISKKAITEVIPLPMLSAEPEDLEVYDNNVILVGYGNVSKYVKLNFLGLKITYNDGNVVNYDVSVIESNTIQNKDKVVEAVIGSNVTRIGSNAFYNCSGLTSIDIPNSVTSIGDKAFYICSGLTSITIGNSVTSIGQYTFYFCSRLQLVTIGNSVTSIGNSAFYNCTGMTSITIPNSVTSIGSHAFSGCSGLTSITIPNSVTSIGEEAFIYCDSLTHIYCDELQIPLDLSYLTLILDANSILTIVDNWKEGASIIFSSENAINLKGKLVIGDRAHWEDDTLVYGSSGGHYYYEPEFNGLRVKYNDGTVIDYDVTVIAGDTIQNKDRVVEAVIGSNVTSIGAWAFSDCSLMSVTIGDKVTSIETDAFYGCTSLISVTIPNSVISIGYSAFRYCNALTSVTLNSNDIVSKTHSDISNLGTIFGDQVKEYVLGDDVKVIGDYAFRECRELTSVVIPESVMSIGNFAFSFCENMVSVTIPNRVTSIGAGALTGCSALTSVTCLAIEPPAILGLLPFLPTGSNIYVPTESVDAYKTAWRAYADKIYPLL